MPRPFEHKNGVCYLNVRMPADLPPVSIGARIMLPIGEAAVATSVGDKVFCSLRVKEPAIAKERFTLAYSALAKQLDALRADRGPSRTRRSSPSRARCIATGPSRSVARRSIG